MAFTSWAFLGFVLCSLLFYYIVPKRMQWVVLLLVSFGFYAAGGIKTIGYLLFTTLSTYSAGLVLGHLNERRKQLPKEDRAAGEVIKRRKKQVVLLAVLANFGLLYVLKYWSVTVDQLQPLLRMPLPRWDFVLPLGLSFYIFQSIGYVIDCYRGKYPPERNVAKFALFVSFFPQMVQGPISRFHQLAPQLTAQRSFDATAVQYGIQLMLWGYFKKMVISDRAGVIVATVFGEYTQYHGTLLAAGVLFYCIQLYCDFSGGIDITRGVAQMFGIDLAENFRRPLFAISLADYWRRWHITLGQWMRDYVFYPLSLSKPLGRLGKWSRRHIKGKAGKVLPTSIATFVVYFLIGIWHGTDARYLVFGFYNGILITAAFLLEGRFQAVRQALGIPQESRWFRLFQIGRTTALVFIGRYLTRAESLSAALWMMKMTVVDPEIAALWDGRMLQLGLGAGDILCVFAGALVILAAECYQERGVCIRETLARRHWLVQWAAILLSLTVLLLFGIMRGDYIASEFIYQQY